LSGGLYFFWVTAIGRWGGSLALELETEHKGPIGFYTSFAFGSVLVSVSLSPAAGYAPGELVHSDPGRPARGPHKSIDCFSE